MTLGLEAARADLFQGGLMAIVTPATTNSAAIKLAADLTRLLGAMPLFADPLEVDGLMAATHLLPQLMAAALLNATVDQPGWREGRKFAGRAYAEATAPAVLPWDSHSLAAAALLNRETRCACWIAPSPPCSPSATILTNRMRPPWTSAWSGRATGAMTGGEVANRSEWVNDGAPGVDMPDMPGCSDGLFGISKQPKPKK